MKNLPLILLSLLVVVFSFGCKQDFCQDVTCENGGTCSEGICDCPEGYTGARCEILLDACVLKKCSETGTEGCVISPVTGEARCNCLDGFEGETCELRWEAKFKNAYSAEESCGFGIGTYPMSVEIGPDPGQVTFINFNNKQPNNIPAKVVANLLTSRVFQIYTQYMAFGAVSGQGSYRTDGGIEFSYQIISNGDTLLCESLLRPN